MDAEYFRTQFDFLYWARDRVLAAADGLTEEEYARPNGFTYKSLRGILTHALLAEVLWNSRSRGDVAPGERPVLPTEADVPNLMIAILVPSGTAATSALAASFWSCSFVPLVMLPESSRTSTISVPMVKSRA